MHPSRFRLILTGLLLGVTGVANLGVQAAQVLVEAGVVANVIAFSDLSAQGQKTHRLILQGGPFPYIKDGMVFGNRERLLPMRPRGYYREYTVPTPASKNRGSKRIICGGPVTAPDACFYTTDHYASFRKIVP